VTIRQDLIIRQGATWSFLWTKRDAAGAAVDLTGYSARMAVKHGYGGSAAAYLSTGPDAAGGGITLGGAAGTVTLAMTADQSAALGGGLAAADAEACRTIELLYDLELVSGAGVVTRELEGQVIVNREVTA
jgi:hypothetical protein